MSLVTLLSRPAPFVVQPCDTHLIVTMPPAEDKVGLTRALLPSFPSPLPSLSSPNPPSGLANRDG